MKMMAPMIVNDQVSLKTYTWYSCYNFTTRRSDKQRHIGKPEIAVTCHVFETSIDPLTP